MQSTQNNSWHRVSIPTVLSITNIITFYLYARAVVGSINIIISILLTGT